MKYTTKEVRAIAKRLHDDITVADGDALMASDMLTAYAARIEADEMAADYPECSSDPASCPENEGFGCCKAHAEAITLHPPAQAAQLDGFFIHCDGVTVNVTEAYRQAGFDVLPPTVTLSALQILALAKRPANYGLFPYIGKHRAYGDNEAIILTPGMRFLAVPPATWGGAYSDPPNQQFMRGPAADKPAAEPVAQDDCHVCGCVDDGQCLCTRPHVVPVAQGEVCKICGKDTPHHHLRGTAPTPAPPINLVAVREVIAHLRSFRSNTPPTWAHLDNAADKLAAALQERGNG